MHGRETVELFLLVREDGMCVAAASAFAGVSRGIGWHWGRSELPHGYAGAPPAPLQQPRRGDRGGPSQPPPPVARRPTRLLGPRPEPALGHRHHGVPPARRLPQGLPVARHRLLRRQARRVVRRDEAHGRARRLEPAGGLRDALARRAPGHPLRPRLPLPLARLGVDLRLRGARQEHVPQGGERRQRPRRGLLRPAQERVLPLPPLGRRGGRGLHRRAGRLDGVVPLGAGEDVARLEGDGREPQGPRVLGVGVQKNVRTP